MGALFITTGVLKQYVGTFAPLANTYNMAVTSSTASKWWTSLDNYYQYFASSSTTPVNSVDPCSDAAVAAYASFATTCFLWDSTDGWPYRHTATGTQGTGAYLTLAAYTANTAGLTSLSWSKTSAQSAYFLNHSTYGMWSVSSTTWLPGSVTFVGLATVCLAG